MRGAASVAAREAAGDIADWIDRAPTPGDWISSALSDSLPLDQLWRAGWLARRRLGDAESARPAFFTVPGDWLRPDFYAFVRLEPSQAGVVRLQSIALEPLPQ